MEITHKHPASNIHSVLKDTTYPKIRNRSLSMPTYIRRVPSKYGGAMVEGFNSLKSLSIELPPINDTFTFPFFHLDSSDFSSHVHLKNTTFSKDQRQVPYHSQPSLASHGFGREGKPKCPLRELMNMVGLNDVKKEFRSVRDRIRAARAREEQISVRDLKLDLIITGKSGTGKSTIAKIYTDYLKFLGIASGEIINISEPHYRLASGYDTRPYSNLYDNSIWGSGYARNHPINNHRYGPHPISNAGVLIAANSREDIKGLLNDLNARGRYSRIINLEDYSEDDLLAIMIKMLKEDSQKVEGGYDAPFLRMFIRQIGYRKGQEGYRNVNTLREEVKKVRQRQGERLEQAILQRGKMVTTICNRSYKLIESDFLGDSPKDFHSQSDAWKKLEEMAGMEKVKKAIKELVFRRNINYTRKREGKELLKTSLNYVFLGPPGTGKTTVATLFGQIIADLGYTDDSDVVMKKPSDFIGKYVGESEARTQKILDGTKRKTLIIDEAHMFYHSSEYGTDRSDIFRQGIVDTIVAHTDNEPGNNRCIILMGYPARMKEFFRKTNPGLQRRFPLEDAFVFNNYDDKGLSRILDIMLAQSDAAASEDAKAVAMEVLRRERDRPNFGNGGAVRNLVSRALVTYSKRVSSHTENQGPSDETIPSKDEGNHILLQPQDFDPEYDRGLQIKNNCNSLFDGLVGFDSIAGLFEGYQRMAANMRQHNLDPRDEIPFSFIFKGAPGTGKTTTARALGQIYYSMGFLSTTEVVDCSVTDLVGPGEGLTGPKVQNLLDKALGKVLFIDEAYRLGQTGMVISHFAREAVGELVDCMTKERYAHKLVIVLAGYQKDMDKFMATNEGLRSRFTEVVFPNMGFEECLHLLMENLEKKKIAIVGLSDSLLHELADLFGILAGTKGWANARDVHTISKRIIRNVFMRDMKVGEPVTITLREVVAILHDVLGERIS
ncbi:P-loop containing nucleoside triphosphate hydrolase protein [Daldinia sp. FL1419]|nr:P-loop containing nucleoside triphosphate hydrolase protein [Daldinia sp. FL1419]